MYKVHVKRGVARYGVIHLAHLLELSAHKHNKVNVALLIYAAELAERVGTAIKHKLLKLAERKHGKNAFVYFSCKLFWRLLRHSRKPHAERELTYLHMSLSPNL